MRNLSVAEINELSFDSDETLPLTASTFDASTNDVICAFGPTTSKTIIELRRCPSGLSGPENVTTITSWDAPSPLAELNCDEVISLHYFSDSSTICVILAGGDLVLVREKPFPDQERIEIVGSIDVGISAAQWSWNASFLAVVTRAGSLVLMSQQLEPVSEVTFQESDLKLSKHVSVGWGKKETQFQGKRAKALKDPTMPDTVDEGEPSPNDDGKTTISWRGDGAYVAINSLIASSRRVIRVYSAEGVLESVSEPVDGLESALSWRPYGNLIAGIKRTLDGTAKIEVVFFERNGLRHGQFDLRLTEQEMASFGSSLSLAWNADSSILAVRMIDRVQLWTMSNYHYYLKQELRLRRSHDIKWHISDPYRLTFASANLIQSISLNSIVSRGSTCPPFDYGMVGVIDGKKLKLTPLKHANVPPPMAFLEIEAEENIITCAFSRTCQRIAFLTHSRLYLCRLEMRQAGKDGSIRHTERVVTEKKDLEMSPKPTQLVIQHDDQVYLLAPARNTTSKGQAFCQRFTWVNTAGHYTDLRTKDMEPTRDTQQMIVSTNHDEVWWRTSKDIYAASMDTGFASTFSGPSLTTMAVLPEVTEQIHCSLSLNANQALEINGIPKASQVTSFAVTDAHLVYTTANHLLKFAHLTDESTMTFPEDTPEADERCRAIERGAKIVTVIPSIFAVVLQMPRGNLEMIYPRLLVVTGIRNHVKSLEYRQAFLACQNHQVDLNILYDYDSKLWTDNIEKFLDQLKKPARVDEFIQKLKEEDVTATLYKDTKIAIEGDVTSNVPAPANVSKSSKINLICNSLIKALQKRDATYLPNIITAHVCKRPPDLNAALTLVSSLRHTSTEEADIAVAHLCFLTDTNRLFDAALALYDLELTLLVAQNAQRDPREYMPFLQNLQSLPELRRKYTIDNHLKRYAKAATSLHAIGEHEELEAYTVRHQLYSHVIKLYTSSNNTAQLNQITRLHASYLASQSQHASAATLYDSLNDYEAAYPLYALAHAWRESLTCASLIPLDDDKLEAHARSLATTCVDENRDYRAAATIHLEYLSEPIVAADMLCKSSYFAEATRMLSMPSKGISTQIPTIIDPMLTRKFGEILELIADCQTQINSQVPRIEELRIKKAEDPLAFFGGDAAMGEAGDIPDNISLAPTDASTLGGQSMFTRYGGGAGGTQVSTKFGGTVASNVSRKTSKTKRREERKRARGKKGSVYEEEYLVGSVARLIDRVNGTHDEVKRLMSGLRRRGLREQAEKVEEVMTAIQAGCDDARKRVWPAVAKIEEISTYDVDGTGRPSGADGVLYDSQLELQAAPKPPPEVKVWKGVV